VWLCKVDLNEAAESATTLPRLICCAKVRLLKPLLFVLLCKEIVAESALDSQLAP